MTDTSGDTMTDTSFFRTVGKQDAYWETYLSARPDYVQSEFFELEVARQRVASAKGDCQDGSSSRLPVKKSQQHEEPGSLDLITVAEAIALMDMPTALDAFAKVLKPGGTIALWFYGRPHFVSAEGKTAPLDVAANKAYLALADFMLEPFILDQSGELDRAHAPHAFLVRRHCGAGGGLGVDIELPFYSPNAGGLDGVVAESAVGAHEVTSALVDREFWGKTWTAEEAKTFLLVSRPDLDPARLETDEGVRLYRELEQALGGSGVKKPVAWPVVLILAVKK
ncbi:hypothetical protein C8J57DRAFT_1251495 [Mycena rebaudengoi]|nr:hypothetical protein C8J57DRAFT_1251495 [Mycena rebaudengoi]